MSAIFCKVENGVITKSEIFKPKSDGNISFSTNMTDDNYREYNWYPVIGNAPIITSEQKIEGPVLVVDDTNKNVNRVYTVVNINLLDVQKEKEVEIRNRGSELMLQITSPYSAEERDTWATQVAEAKGYASDPNYPTPMLNALTLQRGNTVADQVTRILANELAFKVAVGTILGIQQAKIDQIYAATTIAEINLITW